MKKKTLMSMVLLAIIGTSAVFAQQPTLDKLKFTTLSGNKSYAVNAKDGNISGEVVIPGTYEGLPVTTVNYNAFSGNTKITSVTIPNSVTVIGMVAFQGCTGLKSVTFPASVKTIDSNAFKGCVNLTSVTFLGSNTIIGVNEALPSPGDLRAKYKAGGTGTYTRQAGGDTWTKQGGAELCPYCGQPLPPGFKKQ